MLSPHLAPPEGDQHHPILVPVTLSTDRCSCGGEVYDYVLNFWGLPAAVQSDHELLVEEASRLGYDLRYTSPRWRQSLCVMIGEQVCCVAPHRAHVAVQEILGLLGTPTTSLQYVRFPIPGGPGVFDTLYEGPADRSGPNQYVR